MNGMARNMVGLWSVSVGIGRTMVEMVEYGRTCSQCVGTGSIMLCMYRNWSDYGPTIRSQELTWLSFLPPETFFRAFIKTPIETKDKPFPESDSDTTLPKC